MRVTVKTKILTTVLSIVLMFAVYVLFYSPYAQKIYLLENFNKEIDNDARRVALGVKIAITEDHFEDVQKDLEYLKIEPFLLYVSLLRIDTTWDVSHTKYKIQKAIIKKYPDSAKVDIGRTTGDSVI